MLYLRSIIGVLAHMAMIYGVAMVPLVCHQTINATIPFWAAFCGYWLLGETIDTFTKVAMVFCFSAVVLIATSPYIVQDEA